MRYPAVAALALLSGCISSSSMVRLKPDADNFASEATRPGALVIVTMKDHQTTVGLLEAKLEPNHLCGKPKAFPNKPPPPEHVCVPTADIWEISVLTHTDNDLGASTVFWGGLASSVVLLPFCYAAGSSTPGQ